VIASRRSCPADKPLAETNVDLAFDYDIHDIHDLTRVANLKDVPPGRPRRSLL